MTDVVLPGALIGLLALALGLVGGRFLPERFRISSVWRGIQLFWVAAFVSALALDYGVNEPTAAAARVRISDELATIPQPADSVAVSSTSNSKSSQAFAQTSYRSPRSWSSLRTYFDDAMQASGFVFVREYGYTDSGQDYGGRIACYTKPNEVAHVDTPGSDPSFGVTYWVSITWHLGDTPAC